MLPYYKSQLEFYESTYSVSTTAYGRCGFNSFPKEEYECILDCLKQVVTQENILRICDIGCGNALLLNFLHKNFHDKSIIPFGVDFMEKSIIEAQQNIFPEFSKNFVCDCATNYLLPENIDVVCIDPSLLLDNDLGVFLSYALKQKKRYYIFYTYSDVLYNLKITSVLDLIKPHSIFHDNVLYQARTYDISAIVVYV